MADNLTITVASGTADVATDDISSVHYPISKMAFGANNAVTLVASGAPLPVTIAATGQLAMAASWSVTIASDQAALPVVQSAASNLNAQVVGATADGAADAGNPVKVGGRALSTLPTSVDTGDRVNAWFDLKGRLITRGYGPRERYIKAPRVTLTNTTETQLVAAGAAGVFRDLLYVVVSNTSAVEVSVDIRDALAGTIQHTINLYPDGGSGALVLPGPWPQTTAATAWTVQLSVTATVYVSALLVEDS